jgi:hypothetical protein
VTARSDLGRGSGVTAPLWIAGLTPRLARRAVALAIAICTRAGPASTHLASLVIDRTFPFIEAKKALPS